MDINAQADRIFEQIKLSAASMSGRQRPDLINDIDGLCIGLSVLDRQLTDPEIKLLEIIASVEAYFKYKGLKLQMGIEQEFSFIENNSSENTGPAKPSDTDLYSSSFQTIKNRLGIMNKEEGPFDIGFEPSLMNLDFGILGEVRTPTVSPLEAIYSIRLSEMATETALRLNDTAGDVDYIRIG